MKTLLFGFTLLLSLSSFAKVSDRDFKDLVSRVEILEEAQLNRQTGGVSRLVGKMVGSRSAFFSLTESCERIESEGKGNTIGCAGPGNCSANLYIKEVGREFTCGDTDFVIVHGTLINNNDETRTAVGTIKKADIIDFDN